MLMGKSTAHLIKKKKTKKTQKCAVQAVAIFVVHRI